ncbi:MAG: albusnodin/ikarugamycin family macrolactam cyclase [Mycobacteriales bacterium]
MSYSEAPAVVAMTRTGSITTASRPQWPIARLVGLSDPGDFRTVTIEGAELIVRGQCLAADSRMERDFVTALADRRWERLTYWPGCYALMIRPDDREVILFADVAGQFPWYYAYRDHTLVVGSRATPVAREVGSELDSLRLTAFFAAPTVPALMAGRSAFAAVKSLGGGRALRFATDGLREWTYEALSPQRDEPLEEVATRFREALSVAVRERVSQADRVTADFSGGLDSTALAFLAVRETDSLSAFTYHNPLVPADDLSYAEKFAQLDPRIDHRIVLGSSTSLTFARLDDLGPPSDEPDVSAMIARIPLRLGPVADAGSTVHLVGDGGDALLTAPPSYLTDLLRRGHLRRAVRDATSLAHGWRMSPARLLREAARLTRVDLPAAFVRLATAWERPVPASPELTSTPPIGWWPAPGAETTWLTRSARAALATAARSCAEDSDSGGRVGDHIARQELLTNAADHRLFRDGAADRLGVRLHAPFFDHAVVRACLGTAAYRRADPPRAKPLLAKAMEGLVPAEVFGRQGKGDYTAEMYQGLRSARATLRKMFAAPRVADLGLVEPGPVLAAVSRADLGNPVPFLSLERLVALEVWLRSREIGRLDD